MPAHRLYTRAQYIAIKARRSREWRSRNVGRLSCGGRLMRWYGTLSDRTKLRIVLRGLGLSADDMLDYVMYLRGVRNSRCFVFTP